MKKKTKTLLVIAPHQGYKCIFTLFHAETGEDLAGHWCTNEDFAYGDLYGNRDDRKAKLSERFGEVEVKYIGNTDVDEKELYRRNRLRRLKEAT